MAHYVYKYVNKKNQVLYVGITSRALGERLKEHGAVGDNIHPKYWKALEDCNIYFFNAGTASNARMIESELIRRHKPIANKAQKNISWDGFSLVEPRWRLWNGEPSSSDIEHEDYLKPFIASMERTISKIEEIVNRTELALEKERAADQKEKELLIDLYFNGWPIRIDPLFGVMLDFPFPKHFSSQTSNADIKWAISNAAWDAFLARKM